MYLDLDREVSTKRGFLTKSGLKVWRKNQLRTLREELKDFHIYLKRVQAQGDEKNVKDLKERIIKAEVEIDRLRYGNLLCFVKQLFLFRTKYIGQWK